MRHIYAAAPDENKSRHRDQSVLLISHAATGSIDRSIARSIDGFIFGHRGIGKVESIVATAVRSPGCWP